MPEHSPQEKDEEDILRRINEALVFAIDAHRNQMRKSGGPYMFHPFRVAWLASQLHLSTNAIIASILHDTVEDTDVTLELVEKKFGIEISKMVDSLTRLPKGTENRESIYTDKLMSSPNEVQIVKLLDIADNLTDFRSVFSPKGADEYEHKQRNLVSKLLTNLQLEDSAFGNLLESLKSVQTALKGLTT